MTRQPTPSPPMSYTPTRHLKPQALQQLSRCALPPIELLTEAVVRDSPVHKLRSYVSIYDAKIVGMHAPRVRKELDHFFRLWFRHMYDIREASPATALPVYLPVPGTHPSQGCWVAPSPSPFRVSTDAGYMKLKPLQALSDATPLSTVTAEPHETVGAKMGPTLRVDESVTELLRLYGLRGGHWDTLGDDGVMSAVDYLCARGRTVDTEEVAREEVVGFLETLADVQARQLDGVNAESGLNVLAVLSKRSVFRNGLCAHLITGDRCGIASV